MKPQLKVSAILLLAALSAAPLSAAVESIKIEPTFVPSLSPVMAMEGVTTGKIVVAVAVDEAGKITETMVLAYTHLALVRPCLEAMKEWKFTPARIDGRPVPAQTEVSIDYSAQGVVISRGGGIDVDRYVQQMFGNRFVKRAHTAAELDRVPSPVNPVAPRYATEAAAQGVKGAVEVFFYIDETGAVRMPAVTSGADPYLSQSAVDALRGWRFEPPMHKGHPVLVAARQTFKFGS